LKSLLPIIAKDVTMNLPRNKEEVIQKAQQYDLIYTQLGYLYTILPNAPCSRSGDLSTPGESHAMGYSEESTSYQLFDLIR
jgi:hypothetical protein